MGFTLVQINNLITGNTLAAELAASAPECRRFVTVKGFEKDTLGYYLDDFSALEPEWKCTNPL